MKTRTIGVALCTTALVLVGAGSAVGALPRGYSVQRVDSPTPTAGGNFGIGFVNVGDLNRDGADDLLVGTDEHGGSEGQVFVISGKDGKAIRTINPPDVSTTGTKASFGSYVGKLDDITGDGVPELLITALGVDVGNDADQGRAYVYNGATGELLKRIDMPPADAATQVGRKPAFGRTILSLGNVVGDTRPDIYVGASDFYDTSATNPACNPGPCLQAGRAYVYDGARISGDPNVPLSTPAYTIKNPLAQTDDPFTPVNSNRESMGYSVAPVGDVGSCKYMPAGTVCPNSASSGTPDGYPDYALSDHRVDMFGMFDVGAVLLVDGTNGAIMYVYTHPEPQPASIFGFTNYNQPAIGDVGASTAPDIYEPAMRENHVFTGDGSGYVLNGQFKQGGSPNSISFATFRDPTPYPSGDFGTSSAGIGNVAGDSRNEILIGAYGPHNPGTHTGVIGDAWIFSALTEHPLQGLADPDKQADDGFGTALQPIGDVNGDHLLDFAIGAGLWDGPAGADQGRIFILRSVPRVPKKTVGTVLAPAYLPFKS
jgi:hypothetical protein